MKSLLFSGRRNSDIDITVGSLKWPTPIEDLGKNTKIAMPLLHWSDDDLLQYLHSQRFAPDMTRYEIANHALRDRSDKTTNPDHMSCCIRCLAAERGATVYCPKSGSEVVSFSGLREP